MLSHFAFKRILHFGSVRMNFEKMHERDERMSGAMVDEVKRNTNTSRVHFNCIARETKTKPTKK